LSGEYVSKLKRRARAFLREALSVEDPDLAVFFAEQAMQLYTKAVCFELFGESVRGHRVRELLAVLIKMFEERGFKDVANRLLEFVDKYRRVLVVAEEAYTMSKYGEASYSGEEAKRVAESASRLVEPLEEVVRAVKGVELG